ncbi:MAG: acyl-ACP--UDP-N-acetylglucosamine O-acyltransferase [Paludibacteraceae bacterium]|nr:acyl-ACP--UDP-N-acetylglucosamine O-acyltransferase [Paludibacteraceae bacterium]
MISPLAYIHPGAQVAPTAQIDAFAYVDDNTVIGERTHLMPHTTVLNGARIGADCRLFPGAVVGAIPQDLKYKGEETIAVVGDRCTLRECVTVHRGTASKGQTVIGSDNLIMAYSHVAHDCILGSHIIMSNATQLAGEVEVSDWAIIGGGSLVHQFVRIGQHVMIQGGSRVTKDVPPFVLAGREPVSYAGINSVGLRRRGFSNDQIVGVQDIYRIIFQQGFNTTHAVQMVEDELPQTAERDLIVDFIKNSPRGIIKGYDR